MNQEISELITGLKRQLRARAVTYADVAKALDISEASVKRMFSQKQFTLSRLAQVLALIDLSLSDLVRETCDRRQKLERLSTEQESQIAADPYLLLVTINVIGNWSWQEIVAHYDIDEAHCTRLLAQLDRLGLIELLPQNRIRLLISQRFQWQPNGPIMKFFRDEIVPEYFASHFDKKEEQLFVVNGMLSNQSNAEFQKRLERLADEFTALHHEDSALDMSERHGTTTVLALRRWRLSHFESQRRRNH